MAEPRVNVNQQTIIFYNVSQLFRKSCLNKVNKYLSINLAQLLFTSNLQLIYSPVLLN
jgi:hypothetical protein